MRILTLVFAVHHAPLYYLKIILHPPVLKLVAAYQIFMVILTVDFVNTIAQITGFHMLMGH